MLNPNPSKTPESGTIDLSPDPDSESGMGRETLIYDGQCNFCRASVRSLRMFDWTGRLAFISLHDQRVGLRWPQLSYDQLMDQIWLVNLRGQTFGGADAMRYLSLRMPALWPLAPFLNLPFTMPLWRAVYRWIARNRYRIAGRKCDGDTCSLHSK